MIFVFDRVENIVGKGENAGFPAMFLKGYLLRIVKRQDFVIFAFAKKKIDSCHTAHILALCKISAYLGTILPHE